MKKWIAEQWRVVALVAVLVVALVVSVNVVATLATPGPMLARAEAVKARLAPRVVEVKEEAKEAEGGRGNRPGPRGGSEGESLDALGEQVVKRIQERYMFAPAPPQSFRSVAGVLGDRLLTAGGQTVAIGESYGGAKLIAVNSHWVEFEFEGKPVRVAVFGQAPEAEKEEKDEAIAGGGEVGPRGKARDGAGAGRERPGEGAGPDESDTAPVRLPGGVMRIGR